MAHLVLKTRLDFDGKPLGLPFAGGSGFDSSRRRRVGLGEHRHSGHELTFVFDGEVHWEMARGEPLTLAGGDLAITQPGVPHWGHLQIIEPAAFFWMNVDLRRSAGRLFSEPERARLLRAFTAAGNTVRHAGEPLASELVRLHDDLRGLQASADPLTRAAVRARIGTVLLRSARILSAPDRREPHDYALAAQAFIRTRLADPNLCVADIASHVGISQSRLHALFKERAGMTPNDFLQRTRVEQAQKLLRATDRSVTRIAMECGFSSSQYFATCFRKYAGTTPGRYRARIIHEIWQES